MSTKPKINEALWARFYCAALPVARGCAAPEDKVEPANPAHVAFGFPAALAAAMADAMADEYACRYDAANIDLRTITDQERQELARAQLHISVILADARHRHIDWYQVLTDDERQEIARLREVSWEAQRKCDEIIASVTNQRVLELS